MKPIIGRPAFIVAVAASLLAIAVSPALAQDVTDGLMDQARQRGMEEIRRRTGGTIPGQPAPPADQGAPAVPVVPTSPGGGSGKILVWGDPAGKVYYHEGDAGYGGARGRCMIEKEARASGMQDAKKQKGK